METMTRRGAPGGVIVNPAAGIGRARRALWPVREALERHGRSARVHVTTAPRDAIAGTARFAEEGCELVLAVGGDGTINEVANGLLDAGRRVSLGIVPAGRGSDFVRTLGGPKDVSGSAAAALTAVPRLIDAGRATLDAGTSRWFVNAAGVGLDAEVADRVASSRLPGTLLPYLGGVLGAVAQFCPPVLRVETDGAAAWDGPAWSVAIANGRYVGGGMAVVPTADLADGCLDLAAVGGVPRRELLRHAPRVYRGTHVGHPRFWQSAAGTVQVETLDGRPARVQLDGEAIGTAPVRFTVVPAVLRVAR